MPKNEWQRRSDRARQLASQHPPAAEVLRFYAAVADVQQNLWSEIAATAFASSGFGAPLPDSLIPSFVSFLAKISQDAPPRTARAAEDLRTRPALPHSSILNTLWQGSGSTLEAGASDFLARAFLQPFAVSVRMREHAGPARHTPLLCPFCGRKPGLGVLHPQGDGGLRSLICSFCLGEWEFRRILCAACGEENHAKLPIYTAEEFPHVRVECCDTCRCYTKTVDLTKNGRAEPIVDEIAAIPLDLWAQQQGYAKLHRNLMQM